MRGIRDRLRGPALVKLAGVVALLVVLLGWPLVWHASYPVLVMTLAGIYALLAVGLQVLMGQAGQISIGQAAFFGMGAYATAILTTKVHLPIEVAVILAVIGTGIIAYAVGRPILRLKGYFLALATMGLAMIFLVLVKESTSVTGGQMGISGIPWFRIGGLVFDGLLKQFYLVWVVVLLVTWRTVRALRSRAGRAFKALAANEVAASTLGVRTPSWKLRAFVLSAVYSALAGSLYGCIMTSINWRNFQLSVSILILLMVVVGGMRSPVGAVAGAVLVSLLSEGLSAYQEYSGIIYALILIVLVLFVPVGLLPGLLALYRKISGYAGPRLRRQLVTAPAPGESGVAAQLVPASGPAGGPATKSAGRTLPQVVLGRNEAPAVETIIPGAPAAAETVLPQFTEEVDEPRPFGQGERGKQPVVLGEPLLRLDGVSVSFGGLNAVRGASMEVKQGSITSLIGPKGAGKTTLFNVITGLQRSSSGRVMFLDRELGHLRPPDRTDLGMARTFQNLRLFHNMTVLENVMVGRHRHERAGLITAALGWRVRAEEERSRDESLRVLERVGLKEKADWAVSALPYGEQRLVEIARALAAEPSLLLLDEPAAGMNAAERALLVERIAAIRDLDVTVLLVEHDLQLVMDISDEIYVLDHGEIIASGRPREVRANPKVIEAYVGVTRETAVTVKPAAPSADTRAAERTATHIERQPLLTVDKLSTYYGVIGAVRDVSFDVYPEETLAILGSNGAGKTTLLRTISGLLRPRAGKVLFDGRDITHMRPENISSLGVCQVPEGRLVFPTLSVHRNLRLGAATRRNKAELGESYELVYSLFPRLAERRRQDAGTLSGGEQQMLAIARALMGKPRLLLLDEPLMGLAPIVIDDIVEKLQELGQLGMAVVVVEQHAERVLPIADRAVVMQTGVVTLSGPAEDLAGNERVKELYLGGVERK